MRRMPNIKNGIEVKVRLTGSRFWIHPGVRSQAISAPIVLPIKNEISTATNKSPTVQGNA